jgi:hypothetical protein
VQPGTYSRTTARQYKQQQSSRSDTTETASCCSCCDVHGNPVGCSSCTSSHALPGEPAASILLKCLLFPAANRARRTVHGRAFSRPLCNFQSRCQALLLQITVTPHCAATSCSAAAAAAVTTAAAAERTPTSCKLSGLTLFHSIPLCHTLSLPFTLSHSVLSHTFPFPVRSSHLYSASSSGSVIARLLLLKQGTPVSCNLFGHTHSVTNPLLP